MLFMREEGKLLRGFDLSLPGRVVDYCLGGAGAAREVWLEAGAGALVIGWRDNAPLHALARVVSQKKEKKR